MSSKRLVLSPRWRSSGKCNFRNVSSPIPNFVVAYIGNGYTDIWKLMKTLVDVDFRGNLIAAL